MGGLPTASYFCSGAPKMCSTFSMFIPRIGRDTPEACDAGAGSVWTVWAGAAAGVGSGAGAAVSVWAGVEAGAGAVLAAGAALDAVVAAGTAVEDAAAVAALGAAWVEAVGVVAGAGPVTRVGAADEAAAGASAANDGATMDSVMAVSAKLRTGRRMSQSPQVIGYNYSIVKSYLAH